ncbi:hypothetical protein [Oceanidesulfovibrio indonesiensis]|uniref:hypothetical protein n=1 Tax=Oceanidesulfovibrio indonesiensis TaxID=54767 RepID=UPI00118720E3|nr:hypothetical protein [Oceanidesulfovibrio indonesiensis]
MTVARKSGPLVKVDVDCPSKESLSGKRRKCAAELKARADLDASTGEQALAELASEYGVYPRQVSQRKKQRLEGHGRVVLRKGAKAINTPTRSRSKSCAKSGHQFIVEKYFSRAGSRDNSL